MEVKKYAYIDALRGIAAVGIILHHTPRFYLSDQINSILILGAGGVPLFFILSAFTLFLSNERRSIGELNPVRNFFIRRFFRIAPLFYVLVAYYLLQDGTGAINPDDPGSEIDLMAIVSTLTFTFGLHPYWNNAIVPGSWSIGTEMLFYLILPVLFTYLRNLKEALWFLIFSIVGSKVICYSVAHFLPNYLSEVMVGSEYWSAFMYMYFPAQLPMFAFGIVLYFFTRNSTNTTSFRYLYIPVYLMIGILFLNNGFKKFSTDGLIPEFVIDSTIVFVPLIIVLMRYPIKILVNRITIYLGKISYSLYLTHAIIIHFLNELLAPNTFGFGLFNYLLYFLLITIGSVILSSITYYFIEKPGIALGRRLIDRLEVH